MKTLKLGIMLGLVGAMALPALALPIADGYQGSVKLKFADWEVGTIYLPTFANTRFTAVGDTVSLTVGEIAAAQANQNPFAAQDWFSVLPAAAVPGEDGWGIWRLDGIYGDPDGDQSYSQEVYTRGQPSNDVWGLFYGIHDIAAVLTLKDAGAGTVNDGDEIYTLGVWADGMAGPNNDEMRFDLYEVADGSTLLGAASDRTAIDAYPGIDSGAPFLRGTAVPDVLSGAPSGGVFTSVSDIDRATTGLVQDITPIGSARAIFEVDPSWGLGKFWLTPGTDQDIIFTTNVYGYTGPEDWMARTDDPAFATYSVPEPITVLGLTMGIGGLFGYLRKRRVA